DRSAVGVSTVAGVGSGRDHLDGYAVHNRVARDRVDQGAGCQEVVVDPGVFPGHGELHAVQVVTPAVGQRHDPAPHLVGDFDRDVDRARLGADPGQVP